MSNRPTIYRDCTKCAAYNVNIGMDVDHNKARYGELALLSTHACSASGENTSSCCLYDENTDLCGLSFNDEFLHPCAYCGEWGGLTVENITEINFPKAEHCTTCTKYYPGAFYYDGLGLPSGQSSSLTGHACGYYDQDTTNCCLYDETTDRCGVYENDVFGTGGEFLHPCEVCFAGITPSSSPSESTNPSTMSNRPTIYPSESTNPSMSNRPTIYSQTPGPSVTLSDVPSTRPSVTTSVAPSESNLPSSDPVTGQTPGPSLTLSDVPSTRPSVTTSVAPSESNMPSSAPVIGQTPGPSVTLSSSPSTLPTVIPSLAHSISPASTPSSSPTVTLSDSPSTAPVVAPSLSPSSTPTTSAPTETRPTYPPTLCENPKHNLVEVQITTDAYGKLDNSFKILMKKEGKFRKRVKVKKMESSSTMTLTRCLPRRKCFRVVVYDSYGDGICCNYGEGMYTVKWNGEEVVSQKQFTDGFRDVSPIFGDGC